MSKEDEAQALLPVTITQADKDAAAEYMRLFPELRLPEAFARHRISHSLPGDVGMCVLLADVELQLKAARIFVTSREKMHPHGVELYDQQISAVGRALEALAPTTPADLGLTVQDQWNADAALVESPTAIEDGDGYLYEPTVRDGGEQAKAALQSALTALADDSTPIVRRVARTRIRHALAALTPSALSGDAGEGEVIAALETLIRKTRIQATCLEHYAEQSGFSVGPIPSVFHLQASHFRTFTDEAAAALPSHQGAGE